MTKASQIREELMRLLSHERTLSDFSEWLTRNSWDAHLEGDDEAHKLPVAIELALAEYSEGHLDNNELRVRLRALMANRQMNIVLAASSVSNTATSSSPTYYQELRL